MRLYSVTIITTAGAPRHNMQTNTRKNWRPNDANRSSAARPAKLHEPWAAVHITPSQKSRSPMDSYGAAYASRRGTVNEYLVSPCVSISRITPNQVLVIASDSQKKKCSTVVGGANYIHKVRKDLMISLDESACDWVVTPTFCVCLNSAISLRTNFWEHRYVLINLSLFRKKKT